MSLPASISVQDLRLVLHASKLRRWTRGGTPQLCALSARPVIEADCSRGQPGAWLLAQARQCRPVRMPAPMTRGHIAQLMERVQREHGRREVLKTWGTGICALLAEPKYTLSGGAK